MLFCQSPQGDIVLNPACSAAECGGCRRQPQPLSPQGDVMVTTLNLYFQTPIPTQFYGL